MSIATTDQDASLAAVHSGGHAKLGFTRSGDGKTFVSSQSVRYPFHITRPFYIAGDPQGMATIYLQSVSGGLYQDDLLDVSLTVEPRASAHVTTQSASIVHTMTRGRAVQRVELAAREGALIEYWPDPMILFPDARLRTTISIEAAPGATVLLGDAYLTHDPEGGDGRFAELACEMRITRGTEGLVCAERFAVTGAELAEHGATAGFRNAAYGTVLCLYDTAAYPRLVNTLQDTVGEDTRVYAGASMLPAAAGLSAKVLAPDAQVLNIVLAEIWQTLRKALTGRSPPRRRK